MPPFSFDVAWCACKKPMALECDAPIPENYFDDLSFEAARFAHQCHLNDTLEEETAPQNSKK